MVPGNIQEFAVESGHRSTQQMHVSDHDSKDCVVGFCDDI